MIWFRSLMFRSVKSLSLTQSKILLWLLTIVAISIGFILTFKNRRNYVSIVINLAIPYEAYILYTYWNVLTWQLYAGLGIAACLSGFYMYIIFSRRIRNTQKRKYIIINRIKRGFLGVRTITSFCLLTVVIFVASSTLFGVSLTKSKIGPTENGDFESWTIANNIEYVAWFQEKTWEELSVEEKTTAMQVIANIECRYLGLPHELTLVTARLPKNTLAAYDDRIHTIQVNIEHFETSSSYDVLESICHEAYHAY